MNGALMLTNNYAQMNIFSPIDQILEGYLIQALIKINSL